MKRLLITMILLLAVLLLPFPTPTKAEQVVKQPVTELSLPAKILFENTTYNGSFYIIKNSTEWIYEIWKVYIDSDAWIRYVFPEKKNFTIFLQIKGYVDLDNGYYFIMYIGNLTIEVQGKKLGVLNYTLSADLLQVYNETHYQVIIEIDMIRYAYLYIWAEQQIGYRLDVQVNIYSETYRKALENITTLISIETNETALIKINNETSLGNKITKEMVHGDNTSIAISIIANETFQAEINIESTAYYRVIHPSIILNINPSENLTVNTTIVFSIDISKGSFDISEQRFVLWFNNSIVYNTSISSSMVIEYTPRNKGVVKYLVLARDIYGFNTTVSGELYIEVKPQVRVTSIDLETAAMIGGGLGGLALLYLVAKELRKRELGGEELVISQ